MLISLGILRDRGRATEDHISLNWRGLIRLTMAIDCAFRFIARPGLQSRSATQCNSELDFYRNLRATQLQLMSCNLQLKCNSEGRCNSAATHWVALELQCCNSWVAICNSGLGVSKKRENTPTHELQAATQAWESQRTGNPCVFVCVSLYGRPLGVSWGPFALLRVSWAPPGLLLSGSWPNFAYFLDCCVAEDHISLKLLVDSELQYS